MSQFDELVLDDKVLEEIANFIIIYCNNQQGIINDYLQRMNTSRLADSNIYLQADSYFGERSSINY